MDFLWNFIDVKENSWSLGCVWSSVVGGFGFVKGEGEGTV